MNTMLHGTPSYRKRALSSQAREIVDIGFRENVLAAIRCIKKDRGSLSGFRLFFVFLHA